MKKINSLEKLQNIASNNVSPWKAEASERVINKGWRERSFRIALKILREIRTQKPENGMSQKKLAAMMGVSPQYINKIVKGNENLTLETIGKLEDALGIKLIDIVDYNISDVIDIEKGTIPRVIDSGQSSSGIEKQDIELDNMEYIEDGDFIETVEYG